MNKLLLSIFLLGLSLIGHAQNESATISGRAAFLHDSDQVQLIVYKYGNMDHAPGLMDTYTSTVHNGEFYFKITMDSNPRYFDLKLSKNRAEKNVFGMLLEAQDSIVIEEINSKYSFKGTGSEKLNIAKKLNDIYNEVTTGVEYDNPQKVTDNFLIKDQAIINQLNFLERQKKNVSFKVYTLLKTDLASEYLEKSFFLTNSKTGPEARLFVEALKSYKGNRHLDALAKATIWQNSENNILYNKAFVPAIIQKYTLDSCYLTDRPFNIIICYDYFKANFSGVLREKLLTFLLYQNRHSNEDITNLVNDAITVVKNADFKQVLFKLHKTALIGSFAYDFCLPDQNGQPIQLSGFRGNVIVLDFWYTGCPACKQLAPYLLKIEKELASQNVKFISVSIDKEKQLWLNSVRKGDYSSPKGINLFTESKGKNHPIINNFNVNSFPTLYIIDKNGKLCRNAIDPRIDNGEDLKKIVTNALIKE
jgi:cytochrome oxidase Cu insertion factor (SCO1/SenC/PrrC family)